MKDSRHLFIRDRAIEFVILLHLSKRTVEASLSVVSSVRLAASFVDIMFGRIRSSSSLDSLERPPSKILKDDCLSIYEATLMKLKLGSQHDSSAPAKDDSEGGVIDSDSSSSCSEAMNSEALCNPANFSSGSLESANSTKEDLMAADSEFSTSSTCTPEASGVCQSIGHSTDHSTERRMKNVSILYLFSKFKSSLGSSNVMAEARTTEDVNYAGMSSSSSASLSIDNVDLYSEQEFIDSLTALSEKVFMT